MVMADIGDRDRGRRRRKRGGRRNFGYFSDRSREYEPDDYYGNSSLPPGKPTTILSKPHADKYSNSHIDYTNHLNGPMRRTSPVDIYSRVTTNDKKPPPILLRARDRSEDAGPRENSGSGVSVDGGSPGPPAPPQVYTIQRPPPSVVQARMVNDGGSSSRLPPPPEMTHAMKLVDDCMMWCESGMEMLLDQTDFLVIGVLGLQGTGKSTILSHLAGNNLQDLAKTMVFRPQNKDAGEMCAHQTIGVDMYVTGERTILLDSQALLSSSVLDHMIHHDKKFPTEYTSAESCVEMQSLQVASFMLTVCNVVVVVLDWFYDTTMLKFLQTAEMLKPSTPQHGQEDTEYYPNVVFVVNKADRELFGIEHYISMQHTIGRVLHTSHLRYKGSISLAASRLLAALNPRTIKNDVNLVLLPTANTESHTDDELAVLRDYEGHPSYDCALRSLRNQLLSVPRQLMAHTMLSEKNWFHYAARSWDSIRKSQLFSEYNRLLP